MRLTKIKMPDSMWKMIIYLAVLIIVFAFLARMLRGSETLADYAKDNDQSQEGVTETSETVTNEEEDTVDEADTDTKDEEDTVVETDTDTKDETNGSEVSDAVNERVYYGDDFYYEPIPEEVKARMKGRSYPDTVDESKISFDDLRYVRLKYHNFDGDEVDGEMVVNKAIADDILEIFYELNANDYRLESVRLIDDFDADDELSMEADNTSSFCYRVVAGTDKLSNHALGMAVDINPLYNPYIVYRKNGETVITPIGSEQYVDRDKPFPYKIDREDLCYKLFTEHGFTWGGDWNSSKDYQHFEKK